MLHHALQCIGFHTVEIAHGLERAGFFLCTLYLGAQRSIAQRMADLRYVDDGGQLLGPQQRHGGHGNAPGLDNAKPARHHHGIVGCAQQHAIAGLEPQLLRQHIGDAIGLELQICIAPAQAFGLNAQTVAAPLAHMSIQQLHGTVKALGEPQLGQLENELGLLLGWRQVVGSKGIDMRGVRHDSHSFWPKQADVLYW